MFNDVSTQASINAPLIRLTSATNGTVSRLPNDGRYFARPTAITLVALSQNTGQIADLRAKADLAQTQIDLAIRQLAELSAQGSDLRHRASIFSTTMNARLARDYEAARATPRSCRAEQVVVPEVGIVRGIVRRADRRIGVAFDFQSEQLRDRLIVAFFTGRMITTGERPSTLSVALAMLQRLWSARLDVAPAPVVAPLVTVVETRLSPATRVYPPLPKTPADQADEIRPPPQRLSKTG